MVCPVTAADLHTYGPFERRSTDRRRFPVPHRLHRTDLTERTAIEEWLFGRGHRTSPMTNEELSNLDLR